jgi:hypothetical protein
MSSRRLAGNQNFLLANCVESSGTLMNSGIPNKKHLYKVVILSNIMWPIQREVHSINLRVEQCQIDTQECLKHHHPSLNDEHHPSLGDED